MKKHHQESIDLFLERYRDQKEFLGILLAGSLAHGYAQADSDVDIILVATAPEYAKRKKEGKVAFSLWDICRYEGGYIDCKVVSLASLEEIALKGSDAARYAFKDARILVTRTPELEPLMTRVSTFPQAEAPDRQHRFVCQLLAWKWYLSQAEAKKSAYLTFLSAQKITLFACRTVLNHNQRLYPYHKWLLEETKRAPDRPDRFLPTLEAFLAGPTFPLAQTLVDDLLTHLGLVEKTIDWPNRFLVDSEMNWLDHEAPVDDL